MQSYDRYSVMILFRKAFNVYVAKSNYIFDFSICLSYITIVLNELQLFNVRCIYYSFFKCSTPCSVLEGCKKKWYEEGSYQLCNMNAQQFLKNIILINNHNILLKKIGSRIWKLEWYYIANTCWIPKSRGRGTIYHKNLIWNRQNLK